MNAQDPDDAETLAPRAGRSDERLQTDRFDSEGLGRDVFYLAVTRTRMPMVVTDPRQPDNPIVFANEAFLDLTGYTRDEVVGRNCRFLQGPETDRETVARVRGQLERGEDVHAELLNYRRNGSTFWNALFISPLRDSDGRIIYFFASQLDVSRRRDAEDTLRQAQKMEALGQLTGGIAHDFNNLLQVIGGHLEIVRRRLAATLPQVPAQIAQSLESAREATRKSARLTQQLLSFARKQQLRGRVIHINALVASACRLAADTLGEGYEIRTSFDEQAGLCRIDPTQAELALLNVLINARDAMPEGGTIAVRTAVVQADGHGTGFHNVPAAGRYVRISVTDEGSGIPAALLPRVIDPFFTTKPEGTGTGLGLSMVYGFAKQSRGAVNLYSEEGVGTTVSLYFPVSTDPLADEPAAAAALPAPHARDRARVLVVDDRVEVAELTATMLGELGHDAEVCHTGGTALSRLHDGAPVDLLLTDIVMPGHMNGLALAQAARALRPGLPVLLMTGFADDLTRQTANGHPEEVIVKPFTADELDARLRRLLATRPALSRGSSA